jgi:hypothetical protein
MFLIKLVLIISNTLNALTKTFILVPIKKRTPSIKASSSLINSKIRQTNILINETITDKKKWTDHRIVPHNLLGWYK